MHVKALAAMIFFCELIKIRLGKIRLMKIRLGKIRLRIVRGRKSGHESVWGKPAG